VHLSDGPDTYQWQRTEEDGPEFGNTPFEKEGENEVTPRADCRTLIDDEDNRVRTDRDTMPRKRIEELEGGRPTGPDNEAVAERGQCETNGNVAHDIGRLLTRTVL
jgi:hypothetical protein